MSVVSCSKDWDKISADILKDLEKYPFLGLDAEWVNRKGKNPVSQTISDW